MATPVKLRHKNTGLEKTGYTGFSWTTLFFGPFPALFRGEFLIFLVYVAVVVVIAVLLPVLGLLVTLIAQLVWCFQFNAFHMRKLIGQGYLLADTDLNNQRAAEIVRMSPAAMGARPEHRDLGNDGYKIFLVKKYKIEKNEALGKMIVGERLFDTIDEALAYADSLENGAMPPHATPLVPDGESWRRTHTIVRTIAVRGGKVFALSGGVFAVPNNNTVFGTMDEAVKFAIAQGAV